ncbi:pyridoxamine 5'-phosphate oxidase family protein [Kitasatospora sp. NPDC088346]|uniref:pyridoxamine 5'-phosphate oxidase family protein n=1 Tax=Kitasatospora sp. NPDC088346 TaxID=3364073 RepID=UPI003810F760
MDRDDRLEALGEAECRRLLSTVPVGRVVYTEHALPAVLPVDFEVAADGRLLLSLREDGGDGETSRALDGTVAAFQAELLDPESGRGWSVLVHGRAELVRVPGRTEGGAPTRVVITPELVRGRRLDRVGRTRRPGGDPADR